MFKCRKDPENRKWHKSKAEAIVCGCLPPKVKPDIHKTAGKKSVTSLPSEAADVVDTAVPAELQSNILKEIDINKEFEKVAEKLNNSKQEDKEKKYKYKCPADCGAYFNIAATSANGVPCCPDCGAEAK